MPPPQRVRELSPLVAPPLIVVSWSVRFPVASTAKIRNFGAPLARWIVLPCPSIVISLRTTGNPVAPYVILFTTVSVCTLLGGKTSVSAPVLALPLQPPTRALVF